MIQLKILSGKMAGDAQVVRRFPFRIGRAAENNLQLDEPGIWDQHLKINFQKKNRLSARNRARRVCRRQRTTAKIRAPAQRRRDFFRLC